MGFVGRKAELEAYLGRCFERLCREALPSLYRVEGVMSAFEVGEYWSKDVQIDVVGMRHDGWIDLGECKWGGAVSVSAAAASLAAKRAKFPFSGGETHRLRVFLRSRPGKRAAVPENVSVHTLEDLYAAGRSRP